MCPQYCLDDFLHMCLKMGTSKNDEMIWWAVRVDNGWCLVFYKYMTGGHSRKAFAIMVSARWEKPQLVTACLTKKRGGLVPARTNLLTLLAEYKEDAELHDIWAMLTSQLTKPSPHLQKNQLEAVYEQASSSSNCKGSGLSPSVRRKVKKEAWMLCSGYMRFRETQQRY